LEQLDEEVSDGGKRRGWKVKKNTIGPLTTLPVIDQEKRRRRRSRTKADGAEEGENEKVEGRKRGRRRQWQRWRVSPQVRGLSNVYP
jgi:hypothetical protein